MGERKIWFITRPERDPVYHAGALSALSEATHGFADLWESNRDLQKQYERCLIAHKLKRNHVSTDGSGGRTWAAMMKTFDYVYSTADGHLHLTKVGAAILRGDKVRENVAKQILTLQIPNAYFLEPRFPSHFEEGFKIRPVRFLLRLANQAELGYQVSKREITFLVLKAKTDSDLAAVTKEIKDFRAKTPEEQAAIEAAIAAQYDHRERSDKGARKFSQANGDVAHTYMLLAEYAGGVSYVRGRASKDALLEVEPGQRGPLADLLQRFDRRYPFNARYLFSRERMAQNNGLDVDSYKASSYGEISPANNHSKLINKIQEILAKQTGLDFGDRSKVREALASELPDRLLDDAVDYACSLKFQALSDSFIESYLGESDPREYENKTKKVLDLFGLHVYLRPGPVISRGPNIELAALDKENHLGLVDCKLYPSGFALSSSLADYMATEYIADYDGLDGHQVAFFAYVASNQIKGEANLPRVTEVAKRLFPGREIKGFMINSKTLLGLLDFLMDGGFDEKARSLAFSRLATNKAYSTIDKALRELGYSSNS